MLTAYALQDGHLATLDFAPGAAIPDTALWVDLLKPTPEESAATAALTGIVVPSEADLNVLSETDRLYREQGITYLEFTVVHRGAAGHPETADMGAMLAGPRLVTVRYAEPVAVARFVASSSRNRLVSPTNLGVLAGLLEAFVSRIGEYVEANSTELYEVSRRVFRPGPKTQVDTKLLEDMLERLGRTGDINAKARDSLASIGRLLAFIIEESETAADKSCNHAFRAIRRDVSAISDYANFVANQLSFVLQAVLGLVGVDQNRVIKMFTVVATLFVPPTLVASIWGMNFEHMPELDWTFGYPFALLTIALSAVLPYLFFRWRGWL